MDLMTLLPPIISAGATIAVTVIGLVATGRARKAERAAKTNEEAAERQRQEAERLRQENADMDARKNHLINELQEDNDRLRATLRARETRPRKPPPPGGDV